MRGCLKTKNMNEEQYKKELRDAGVDTPETKEEPKEPEKPAEPSPEPPADKPKDGEPPTEEPKKEEAAPLQDGPKEQRPRTIYDEYKDRKAELRTEKELREQAERERDELKAKYEAVKEADTPEEKKEATDELEAFAKEINASPEALRKMRTLFLKDVKVTDPELVNRLAKFEQWQAANAKVMEAHAFEQEFQQATPKLKELFPNASPEEMGAIKTELDKLSHTKEWHDKSLAYVAFEHKDTLSALVSPKKRGMESGNRKPEGEANSTEFNPSPDFSKMSLKEMQAWEEEYRELAKQDSLATGANGKKILI